MTSHEKIKDYRKIGLIVGACFLISLFALSSMNLSAARSQIQSSNKVVMTTSASHLTVYKNRGPFGDAGWGVNDSSGSINSVSANIVVPKVNCTMPPKHSSAGVFISIDSGGYPFPSGYSPDIQASAVVMFCNSGHAQYFARWFSFNTTGGFVAEGDMGVSPGDQVSLSISDSSGSISFKIVDHTSNQFMLGQAQDSDSNGPYPRHVGLCEVSFPRPGALANFGSAHYKGCKVNGLPVGSLGNSFSLDKFILFNKAGTKLDTITSALKMDGDFTVTWKNYGP